MKNLGFLYINSNLEPLMAKIEENLQCSLTENDLDLHSGLARTCLFVTSPR